MNAVGVLVYCVWMPSFRAFHSFYRLFNPQRRLYSVHLMERMDKLSSAQLNINDLLEISQDQEILEYIFSYLNIKERIKIERVCKNWRFIGTNFQWKIKELKYKHFDLTDHKLGEILKRCFGNCVLVLDLFYCRRLTAKALRIIGDHCPNLRSIKFTHSHLTDSDLGYFSSKCTKLKEAVLESYYFGEEGLSSFLRNCQELEVLHILSDNNITGLCFQFINPKVKKLRLTDCSGLTPEGFLQLGKCKCIEHLEINYCRRLDEASLEEVLKQNCNSLKHLGLIGDVASQINYQALPFELLTKLESISFRRNYSIKDDTLLKIAHSCKNLRNLDISGTTITDISLKHLISCPLLTTLDVGDVYNITDDSIIPLAMVGNLESLTIYCNENITDNAVHCTKLKFLNVSWCREITDATAHSFINAMKQRNDGHRKLKIFAIRTWISVSIEEDEFMINN